MGKDINGDDQVNLTGWPRNNLGVNANFDEDQIGRSLALLHTNLEELSELAKIAANDRARFLVAGQILATLAKVDHERDRLLTGAALTRGRSLASMAVSLTDLLVEQLNRPRVVTADDPEAP